MTQESQFEGMLQILNGIMNDLLRYCITIVMRAAKWKATFTLQLEVSQFGFLVITVTQVRFPVHCAILYFHFKLETDFGH